MAQAPDTNEQYRCQASRLVPYARWMCKAPGAKQHVGRAGFVASQIIDIFMALRRACLWNAELP